MSERLENETARQPIFDQYPPVMDIDTAIEIAMETVEEWDWADDPHGWCHSRPVWLTLLAEIERRRAISDNEDNK